MARSAGRWIGTAAAIGTVATVAWLIGDRSLSCSGIADARAAEICRHLEAGMEFTWLGHAIISPGYRVSFESAASTFCALGIKAGDVAALRKLLEAGDWRLQNGADILLRLGAGQDRYGMPEPETSLFNPAHPDYVLKNGCGD